MRDIFLRPINYRLDCQEGMLRVLADANFRTRAMHKMAQKRPIRVLFVCHEPALWSMFESIYQAMTGDPEFSPMVVVLPYAHVTLPKGKYKDGGMMEALQKRNIPAVSGYDKEKNEWMNPASLSPDYIFFQTPYHVYPPAWSVEQISMMAKVCYVPYGATVFGGDVLDLSHPADFFRFVRLTFTDSPYGHSLFADHFKKEKWFDSANYVLSGFPKLDGLIQFPTTSGKAWRRGIHPDLKRILWTPRWRTSEGNCHFLDYKDYFIQFCREHPEVDFVFRPHPLCLHNFLRTGELTESELGQMEQAYISSTNMTLDRTGDYQDTFLSSDVLVSDISSMLVEYFATGKPIVYTHRVDSFNEFGHKISEGFYWVRNAEELEKTLKMLISGHDPLREKRSELMKLLMYLPKGGAGSKITEIIRTDFQSANAF